MSNIFMLIIGGLQIIAAGQYFLQGKHSFGFLIFFYAITNFILYYQGETHSG